jgi:uncharacterized protein
MPPAPDFAHMSLADIAKALTEKRLPPVETWNPAHCGDSEIRIARDGRWYHQGATIDRVSMIRLFSTILRREPDGRFVLVTPTEKLDIEVEDAPFQAVEIKSEGKGATRRLAFRLNTDELVIAGPNHGLRFADDASGPIPYLQVRNGLEARVARPAYYDLAELALNEGSDPPGLWSDGAFFALTTG